MTTHQPDISNTANIINSRDIIARIEILKDERDDLRAELDEAKSEGGADDIETAADALTEWNEDNGDELAELLALQDEAEGSPDWPYGETLVRDSYFVEYAQQLAEDSGMLEHADKWPCRCIDWMQAAEELQQDYFQVDYAGETYWIRS